MISTGKRAAVVLLTSLGVFATADAWAEMQPAVTSVGTDEPRSFLFVGNSFMYYNNSMHKHFNRLTKEGDEKNSGDYRATSVTISGSGLNWHDMQSYFRPDALAEYSFVADNQVRFNDYEQLYDVVIMMDCSQCPIHPRLKSVFHEYAAKHSETIIDNGARPVLLMTWAYEDRPEMTAALAEQYTTAGNNNALLVVPAGLAFAEARRQRPDLKLYQPDKRHPSPAGTYLAALTIYASIFNQSPLGYADGEGLDTETSTFLQKVAWETVNEYFDR